MEDDMSFSDWSAHLDSLSADSNHCWLPAYGLQPPDQGPTQQQFLFLETIQEETSDDLRSESSRSSHSGWPESDSDAGSVIHIAATYNVEDFAPSAPSGTSGPPSWSGSERDLAVPPKRRRQDRQDEAVAAWAGVPGTALSRSSSLIAFESLERRLSEEDEALSAVHAVHAVPAFRTTATLRPFDWADSRSASASPSDSSDDEDSDDSLLQSFNSSRGSFRSSTGSERLRSFRSLDSLSALGALGGGGTVNSGGAAHLSRPCQDLSMSSADGDGSGAQTVNGDPIEPLGRQERSHSLSPKPSLRSLLDATYSLSDHEDLELVGVGHGQGHGHSADHSTAMTRDDFLDGPDEDIAPHQSSSSSSNENDNDLVSARTADSTGTGTTPSSARTQRSAENLSEDSGFGEHAAYPAAGKRLTVCPILEDDVADDDDHDASCASSCYSACSSSSSHGSTTKGAGMGVNLEWGGDVKFSTAWHCSAPDLLACTLPPAVADARPLSAHAARLISVQGSPGRGKWLPPTMASTPDLENTPLNLDEHHIVALPQAPGKGVHFCPVVAEVSWRESYSDGDDEDEDAVDEADGHHQEEEDDVGEVEDSGVEYKLHVGTVVAPVAAQQAQQTATSAETAPHAARPLSPPRVPPRAPPRAPPAPPTAALQPASGPGQGRGRGPTDNSRVSGSPVDSHSMAAPRALGAPAASPPLSPSASPKKTSRIGDFFQRFSLRRLSGRHGRHHDHAQKLGRSKSAPSSPPPGSASSAGSASRGTNTQGAAEDVRIIPLHPTPEELEVERREEERRRAALKPPLPPSAPPRAPRGVGRPLGPSGRGEHAHHREARDVVAAAAAAAVTAAVAWRSSSSMAGLLETDLDADLPLPPANGASRGAGAKASAKARSLLDVSGDAPDPRTPTSNGLLESQDCGSRAKSMEFLLDRRNQEAVQPPENALQGLQGRVLSEHELRVQRSLQQLNVPDWYKNSARPTEGFLLKRGSDAAGAPGRRGAGGWPGLGVKTTSLSSLRSPTAAVRLGSSPSPPPSAFTRWSSSRLHSAGTGGSLTATPSTSPCGSTRSSFNHRQPYLGWRSQERLSGTPRTPAERLAQGLLEQREQQRQQQQLERLRGSDQAPPPNLSEVRSSIKEVTSAIVHYVSAANGPGSTSDVRLTAPVHASTTSSPAERHGGHGHPPSSGSPRVCWIESSFVGSRPIEQPQTPDESAVSSATSPLPPPLSHQDLYLDLKPRPAGPAGPAATTCGAGPVSGHGHGHGPHQSHGRDAGGDAQPAEPAGASPSSPAATFTSIGVRPSPSSTTMEDVLDSLLGLPPPSRSPSPSPAATNNGPSMAASTHQVPQHAQHTQHSLRSCADIRPDPAGSASGALSVCVPPEPPRGTRDNGDPDDAEKPAGWEAADLAGLQASPRVTSGSPVALPGWGVRGDPLNEVLELPAAAPPGWQGTAVVGVVADDDFTEEAEFGVALLSVPLDPVRTGAPSPRRRRSESSAQAAEAEGDRGPHCPKGRRPRRVSFDLSAAGGGAGGAFDGEPGAVACRRVGCGQVAPEIAARLRFKTCHNCAHTYCSRECRREHWDSHKRACAVQRVGSLLRRVVARVRQDTEAISTKARCGYAAHGRGVVRLLFHSTDAAEAYVAGEAPAGTTSAGQELVFVRWADLPAGELGGSLHEDLTRLCNTYNPRTRAVTLVVLEVLSEAPSDDGVVMWERQLVSRVFKVHLFREEHTEKTIVLEGVSGRDASTRSAVLRNIMRALGQRGVDLRDESHRDALLRVREFVDQGPQATPATPGTLTVGLHLHNGARIAVVLVSDAASDLLDLGLSCSERGNTEMVRIGDLGNNTSTWPSRPGEE